jgi:hypothetical protein
VKKVVLDTNVTISALFWESMIEFKNWLGSSGDGDEVVRRNPDEEILRLY